MTIAKTYATVRGQVSTYLKCLSARCLVTENKARSESDNSTLRALISSVSEGVYDESGERSQCSASFKSPGRLFALEHFVFADESGTHDDSKCYGIGALCVSQRQLEDLVHFAATSKATFHLDEELKWTRIRRYNAAIQTALQIVDYVLDARLPFHIIVVKKAVYRLWSIDTEEAFYKSYWELLTSLAKRTGGSTYSVVLDNHPDAYDKQHEVLQVVTNRYLAKVGEKARLLSVEKGDSKLLLPLQCVDLLTGAVTSSTNCYLDHSATLSPGKAQVIQHFCQRLGWDTLAYDTYPNKGFNIWHFPREFRAEPGSRRARLTNA